ncbi:lipid-A-disaccharide synthase [Desulfonatronum thioautotrophicum]|uniref:lipid-A-disaccharide synthase n=1 Tax=Desulfonatronum thioautotrophicum TaxID=617001 RepID=UPI000A88EC4C|nr:lipid-A-disaccharide synthase [Desulfonatronum thioautotrophicum]
MTAPQVWLNACEPSGDMHAASLAGALREQCPQIRLRGMGGEAMQAQQVELLLRMEGLSVMGVSEVVAYLPRIFGMWRTIRNALVRYKPDAIVLVDSPDFHFRVARMASALGIPVFYYISPQVWAWRQSRVAFLRRHVRRMFCILPFEPEFYRARGMAADFVGHPLMEELSRPDLQGIAPLPNLIGILPGSRKSEIQRMMPVFAQAAEMLLSDNPGLEFCVVKAPSVQEQLIREHCPVHLPLRFVEPTDRYATMRSCSLVLATSGTATLECALLQVPTIVAYRFSQLSFLVGVRLVRVPAISLANLILRRPVLPEFLQHQARPETIADQARSWLVKPEQMDLVRQELARLPDLLAMPDISSKALSSGAPHRPAAHRVAEMILGDLTCSA